MASFTWTDTQYSTREVLGPVEAVVDGRAERLPRLNLSDAYLSNAGIIARVRVRQAGHRLAAVWAECLNIDPEAVITMRPEPPKPASVTVWVTDSGEKYHREDCRYCDQSGIGIDLSAVRRRMEPCKVCRPPE